MVDALVDALMPGKLGIAIPDADQKLIASAKARYKQGIEADRKQRERELEDLRFYAGDQWDEAVKRARQGKEPMAGMPPLPARPTFVINETRPPVLQIINQIRGSEFDFEIAAADDFADVPGVPETDDPEIEVREGLVRRIQRAQETADARLWAATRATIAGRGFYRVMTRFLPGLTMDQEIYVERVYNQASVVIDPAHDQPDGSDALWYFIGADLPQPAYESQFPFAEDGTANPLVGVSDDDFRALGDEAPDWFTTTDAKTRMYRVVEHFYTEYTSKTICELPDGSVVYKEDVPADVTVPKDRQRQEVIPTIKWIKTDGVQILERTDWPGPDLNLIKVIGEELQPYDGERRAEGMVRPMRDPGRGVNAMVSKFVETVAFTPIEPPIGTAEQMEPFKALFEAVAAGRNVPYALYYPHMVGGQLVSPPGRMQHSSAEAIAAIGGGLQMFKEALQAVSLHDPSLGKVDPSLKSGVALKTLVAAGAQGMSHYLDNLKRSVRREAHITNNLLYPVFGKKPGRVVRIVTGTGENQAITLGVPDAAKAYRLTPGTHYNIAVKLTPSSESRNAEIAGILSDLIGRNPQMMGVIGDLFFKYLHAAGSTEMAERFKAVLDPKVQAMLALKQSGSQIPPEVQAQMQQMQQRLQEIEGIANQAAQELQSKQLEQETKLKQTQMEIESKERLAAMDRETKLAVAELTTKSKDEQLFLEERGRLGLQTDDHVFQAHQAELDRQHEAALAVHKTELEREKLKGRKKTVVTKTLNRGDDGALLGATEEHSEVDEPNEPTVQ